MRTATRSSPSPSPTVVRTVEDEGGRGGWEGHSVPEVQMLRQYYV